MILYWYIFAGLTLVISASGFFRLVYFVSIGYAFSMAAMALAGLILFRNGLKAVSGAHAVLLILYGLRLGSYLVIREGRSAYAREQQEIRERDTQAGLVKRLFIWLGVSLLYLFMITPGISSLQAGLTLSPLTGTGIILMAGGILLEALSDAQKSAFKKKHPAEFCRSGLYRIVRCPNYLGEIIFWTGNFLIGSAALLSLGQWYLWPPAVIGYICINLIMLGSTKRLEEKQNRRYGDLQEFQDYSTTVPVIIPFVPLYTLKNLRVFLE